MKRPCHAFTLAELLVSVAILTLLSLMLSRMVGSASIIAILASRTMDTESQIGPVLSRMTLDFAQMIKRPDVDCYRKSSINPESGNDQIAFFCNVPGYYPSTGSQSPLSLISYRIDSSTTSSTANKMQRMCKGLLWNGVGQSETPMIFGLQAITTNWPAATSGSASDLDYELIGPQIFRFEYYYLLKTGALSDQPGSNGWQDIGAIVVAVAAIDEKSRALLSLTQFNQLTAQLKDFDPNKPFYDLITSWRETLLQRSDFPRLAINGVRVYQRSFYLDPPK